ncbi:MAG: cell envelope integrity protein CreD [Rhodospirillales bacterium]|nr:cell envelope integrity protein CreD [Rhodospirillales bacterium]
MRENRSWAKGLMANSRVYLKMGFLLALVLVLFVPLQLIEGLIAERMQRRDTVVDEISRTWGEPQVLKGPVLLIPYRKVTERQTLLKVELLEDHGQAFWLPDSLEVRATIVPEVRYRGIFEAIVYTAGLKVSGSFAPPDFAKLDVSPEDLLWSEAILFLGVSDLRGTTAEPQVTWGDETISVAPGTGNDLFDTGIHAVVPMDPANPSPTAFSLNLGLSGSRSIAVTPAGKTTTFEVASSWPHASFAGAYLPTERSLEGDGFQASWTVSYLGREYPQAWTSADEGISNLARRIGQSQFGVSLISPVDFYLKSERSAKHGALLIVLIVAAIFIFEIVAPVRIHLFQYALVGFALCLFYLLLLSLSETVGFFAAYGLAAAMSTALITLYLAKALASKKRALVIAGVLAAVYGYLYIVLQLEAFALVSGAFGLFVALAAVMYATRNVDWYATIKS